jgi:predicted phage tail protein
MRTLWYWRVFAQDVAGNSTAASNNPFSFTLDTVAPPAPTLLSPPDGSMLTNSLVLMDWSDVSDPSGITYTVEVDDDSLFGSPLISQAGLSASLYQTNIPDGAWYWRVRAVDGAGNASAWSATWSFVVDTTPPPAPYLVAPPDGAFVTSPVALDWTDVLDVNGVTYFVEIIPAGTWAGIASSNISVPLSDGAYSWHVRAVDGAGNASPWSATWTFVVDSTVPDAPVLVAPVDGAIVGPGPVLDWQPVSNVPVPTYEVQVDDDPLFGSPNWTTTTLDDAVAAGPFVDGTYSWRVRAISQSGVVGSWSAAWTFTVDATPPSLPALVSPPNGSTVTISAVAFDWTDATDANGIASYEIEVYAGATLVWAQTTPSSAASAGGLADGTYSWRVRAVDNVGNVGSWTAPWTFTKNTGTETNPPTVPVLSSPPDGTTVPSATVTLQWLASTDDTGVAYYVVQVDDGSSFAAPLVVQATTSALSLDVGPLAQGTYWWRVRAVDVNGNISAFSSAWSFTIAPPDTTPPPAPLLIAPSNGITLGSTTVNFD